MPDNKRVPLPYVIDEFDFESAAGFSLELTLDVLRNLPATDPHRPGPNRELALAMADELGADRCQALYHLIVLSTKLT